MFLLFLACGTPGLDDMANEDAVGARLEVMPTDEVRFTRSPQGVVVTAEVTVSSVGDAPALVEGVWVEGSYAEAYTLASEDAFPGRLVPGASVVLEIAFEPPAIGRFPADLYVSAPDTPSGGITRPMVGRGCEDIDHNDRCD